MAKELITNFINFFEQAGKNFDEKITALYKEQSGRIPASIGGNKRVQIINLFVNNTEAVHTDVSDLVEEESTAVRQREERIAYANRFTNDLDLAKGQLSALNTYIRSACESYDALFDYILKTHTFYVSEIWSGIDDTIYTNIVERPRFPVVDFDIDVLENFYLGLDDVADRSPLDQFTEG